MCPSPASRPGYHTQPLGSYCILAKPNTMCTIRALLLSGQTRPTIFYMYCTLPNMPDPTTIPYLNIIGRSKAGPSPASQLALAVLVLVLAFHRLQPVTILTRTYHPMFTICTTIYQPIYNQHRVSICKRLLISHIGTSIITYIHQCTYIKLTLISFFSPFFCTFF